MNTMQKFWQHEPTPCFPEFVAELGDGIRKLPNRDKYADRHTVFCDACGHAVGRTTPNMGKFGGGQFISFAEEQKHNDWLKRCGLSDLEFVVSEEK